MPDAPLLGRVDAAFAVPARRPMGAILPGEGSRGVWLILPGAVRPDVAALTLCAALAAGFAGGTQDEVDGQQG